MDKIKVLHLLATDKYSGAESVVFDIITNSSKKFEHVYCSLDGEINEVLLRNNITFIPIKKINRRNIKKVINSYKPDIIHAHDFRVSAIAANCKNKSKLISHIHNNALWLKKICIKSIIFLFSSLKADKVLIVSEAIREEFIFKKFILEKMICVNNPVIREKVLKKADINSKKINNDICCVARITEAKNPFLFLSIIKELTKNNPQLKAIWVGDGELKEKVLERCKELGLDDNIQFVGFKDNPYNYLVESKIFVLTSKWEGYGLAAFEALTLGKPCVVSNVGGLTNIIDDNCGKICRKDSTNDYVEEIEKLLSDSNYYNKKVKEAIKKSILLDNKAKYFKQLESIYIKTLKKDNRNK